MRNFINLANAVYKKKDYLGSIGKCYTYKKKTFVPGFYYLSQVCKFPIERYQAFNKTVFHAEYSLVFHSICNSFSHVHLTYCVFFWVAHFHPQNVI